MGIDETVGAWLGLVHRLYPPAQAADWDHVGLQVGDPAWPVARVLVTLDVTSAVLYEAAKQPDTLVLAHHPLLFRPLRAVTPATVAGRLALRAIEQQIAVVAAHTNLDVATDGAGTSDPVVELLELEEVRPLTTELREGERFRLVTFVPPDAVERVIDALAAAGAGTIGNYERCSFRVLGTGTFRPLPGANPYSGEVGRDAAEEEHRLEMELPRAAAGRVVTALHEAHPYEQVAYDLLGLIDGADVGFGRVGVLDEPMPLGELAALVGEHLPAPHLRFAGDPQRLVARVATSGGSGESLIGAAIASGADVFVTGDVRHHAALDALEQGLAIVDAGHHATEAAALAPWIERLRQAATHEGLRSPVVGSQTPTSPWA